MRTVVLCSYRMHACYFVHQYNGFVCFPGFMIVNKKQTTLWVLLCDAAIILVETFPFV